MKTRTAASTPRSAGITLTEILISILILGVGLVSLATLFPIGLLRLREARADAVGLPLPVGHCRHGGAGVAQCELVHLRRPAQSARSVVLLVCCGTAAGTTRSRKTQPYTAATRTPSNTAPGPGANNGSSGAVTAFPSLTTRSGGTRRHQSGHRQPRYLSRPVPATGIA